ncbi:MAG: hypothetical protein ACI8ZM_002899 [Crocinitomix sp.]|jgi:hypothetical protein
MKTCVITLLVILVSNNLSFGQEIPAYIRDADSVNIAYEAQMQERYDSLDYFYLPTGRLYERGFSFVNIVPFNGQITDSSKSNLIIFSLAYAAITSMTVDDAQALPAPSSYRDIMDTIHSNSDIIAIAGMHQLYNSISPNALEDNLLTVSGSSFLDVLPRAESPYLNKEVFMFAPSEMILDNPSFSLYFDSNLFYSNAGKSIDSLWIDTGHEMGYLAVDFDENIQLTYTESGRKTIQVKLQYSDGTVYFSHFDLLVRSVAFRDVDDLPDFTHLIPSLNYEVDPSLGRGAGNVYTYLACGHDRIEKPFIWAEAFNPAVGSIPANLTKEDILMRLAHVESEIEGKTLLQYLQDNGYDIVILDYKDGADYLPRTAEFIKESIRYVNQQKAMVGSNALNIILGQSMGGVCTMQALKEMENDGEEHQCEKFIIFDSPIMGANIPMSAQASLLDMASLWVNRPYSPSYGMLYEYVELVEDIVRLLYLPATRTMMVRQCNDVYVGIDGTPASEVFSTTLEEETGGPLRTEHLYTDHYDYLHNEMGGMPTECEVMSITNGSREGPAGMQDFDAGDLIIHANVDNMILGSLIAGYLQEDLEDEDLDMFDTDVMSGTYGLLLWAVGIGIDVDIRFYAMENSTDFEYYKSDLEVSAPLALLPVIFHHNNAITSSGLEIDHVPGGFFGIKNQGVFFEPDGPVDLALSTFKMHTWCFTPTGSVLNYHGETGTWLTDPTRAYTDNYADITANKTRGITSYMSNSETPEFTGDPLHDSYKNTAHTWFTEESSQYLIYHLIGSNELEGIDVMTSKSFNFGRSELTPSTDFTTSPPIRTTSILDHSLFVNNTDFNVNNNDLIGLTPSPYSPDNMGNSLANTHFVMHLGHICETTPQVVLTINNGANMAIGDGDTRTGTVLVQEGHELVVNNEGEIHIKSGSTLRITEGSTLIIEGDGVVIIDDDGSLIVEEGGLIEFYEGGEFQLNGSDAKLILDGKLHLHNNADFRPLHEGVSSGMVIISNADGGIIGESGSSFRLIGDGDDDVMLQITENGLLEADSDMTQLLFASCKVIIAAENEFAIKSYAPFTSADVNYEVQDNLILLDQHPAIGLFNKTLINSSDFMDVLIRSERAFYVDGIFMNINNSTFEFSYKKSKIMFELEKGNLSIQNSQFKNYMSLALYMDNQTSYSQIVGTDFITSIEEVNTGEAVLANGSAELMVKNCSFTGGGGGVNLGGGQVTLKCNNFSNINYYGILGSYNGRIEMSTGRNAGYNSFDNMSRQSIKMNKVNGFNIYNGYNYFWDDGTIEPTVYGSIELDLDPGYGITLLGHRNQWNVANVLPTDAEFDVWSADGGDFSFSLAYPTSNVCGAMDPDLPYSPPIGEGAGDYMPDITLTGEVNPMRLDTAIAVATAATALWNPLGSDLTAITLFHDILMHSYTPQELADKRIQYLLNEAYNGMKFTIGHAIADSVILESHNGSGFSAPIQKYVDVLNTLTNEDTISKAQYFKRFNLEMDKAHLFRMVGHTDMGLNILKNTNFCILDSSEQAVLNKLMFVFEEDMAKEQFGSAAYGLDTVFTDISGYHEPTASQATEFYFGSVINSLTSITYRTCTGTKSPESITEDDDAFEFALYPNPSNGMMTISYNVPTEGENRITIYTMDGKEVFTSLLKSGRYSEQIDISHVQSGIYLYKISLNNLPAEVGRISISK